ncbi:MAG TPA: HAD-IIIC family phosphatase [Thermoanaerobaculia bacterium]|nr:HAD-IIIC family phosphatase [Thermoanaerobaculia bacterium]
MEKPRDSKLDTRALAEALAAAPDAAALQRALGPVDLEKLPANDVSLLSRSLQKRGGPADVKLAYLSNFTLDLLPRWVDVHFAREGLSAAHHLGGFGQYVQEVLGEGSGLARFQPDLVLLALSLRLLRPEAWASFASLSAAERRDLREDVVSHVESWALSALERVPATLLIANFPLPSQPAFGIADLNAEYGETEFHLDLNLDLLRRFKGLPRVQVFDAERLASRFGKERLVDRRMYYLAKMEWSPAFLGCVAGELVRHARAAQGRARKCLVLDLDNTLWGGVVGEDGPAGVKIGSGDPEGEAFLDLQLRLKALQAQGVLLAVCSKNNPGDVHELFESRPEMPLKLSDFAAVEISWEPKHEGLKKIAAALNLGTDSLVFMDDNPAEISLIAQMLPEVKTVLLPPDPAEYAALVERMTDFERTAVLEEDARKTSQYRENRRRQELQAAAGDLATYLASLRTELAIGRARRDDLPRVHQLFTKTNQFNLTTQRYTPAEVERFIGSPICELWVARARDRFGELGTIGAILLKRDGRVVYVDSFLMSCRAMGRGIETALMNHLKHRLLDEPGHLELRGRYVPTAKNKPVETFYEDQGFRLLEHRESGEKLYVLRRPEARMKPCDWIEAVRDEMALGFR